MSIIAVHCGGDEHTISVDDHGEARPLMHDIEAELITARLGGDPPACVVVVTAWELIASSVQPDPACQLLLTMIGDTLRSTSIGMQDVREQRIQLVKQAGREVVDAARGRRSLGLGDDRLFNLIVGALALAGPAMADAYRQHVLVDERRARQCAPPCPPRRRPQDAEPLRPLDDRSSPQSTVAG